VALSRQSAPPARARRPRGARAPRPKTPGGPETHGRRRKVQALRRGDQGWSGAHDVARPQRAVSGLPPCGVPHQPV